MVVAPADKQFQSTDFETEDVSVARLAEMAAPYNPRKMTPTQMDALQRSMLTFGVVEPVICNRRSGHIVGGHQRVEAATLAGFAALPVFWVDLDATAEKQLNVALNRISGAWDDSALVEVLQAIREEDGDLALTGFEDKELARLLGQHFTEAEQAEARTTLAERFGVPPFSILDGRQGYWLRRKRAWNALGIHSAIGRPKDLVIGSLSGRVPHYYTMKREAEEIEGRPLSHAEFQRDHLVMPENANTVAHTGTSIFDPVLAELAVRWFSPPAGRVLDPFAGGSVRGIVAAMLGREYVGVDLSGEQVTQNRLQVEKIPELMGADCSTGNITDPTALTPVERRGSFWIKRDDLFSFAGVRGGKVRTCVALAKGAVGLVTAGSRSSPQVNIVASVARALGVPVRCHTPGGTLSPEVSAAMNKGAEIVQHPAGYNNVIRKRARDDAAERGWTEIPFGMECDEAVAQTRRQAANLPDGCERLVVPVGSGMSLAGILHGLDDAGLSDLPVLGVCVGADPSKRLDQYAPADWRARVALEKADRAYDKPADVTEFEGVELDPIYEAKAVPFLRENDCLWVVGVRETALAAPRRAPVWIEGDSRFLGFVLGLEGAAGPFDLVFSCPPYHSLEHYSDDPADLSNMTYEEFLLAYREIISAAAGQLAADSFAVWVVGEIRDNESDGAYRCFVADTIRAFTDAGMAFVNDAVLLTPIASMPVRAAKMFESKRRLIKGHQNVLVFCKGDVIKATQRCGSAEFTLALPEEAPDVT